MRVMVVGATGAVGSELVSVLEARRFPVTELVPVATDRSLGADVAFHGDELPVAVEVPDLRRVDLVFLCAPASASFEVVREALRVETPCIDLSGAFAWERDVPLLCADLPGPPEALRGPLVALPIGPSLAWALALAPLRDHAGLRRVVGACLSPASSGGRQGMEALSRETVAILNQSEIPEPTVFDRSVAFDCIPTSSAGASEESRGEVSIERDVPRLLDVPVAIAASSVQVPTFVGDACWLSAETEREVDWSELGGLLGKAPGIELWESDPRGPSTRSAAGRDVVIVARLRRDPTSDRGVLLWIVADTPHLVASHAVRLAEARFRSH